MQAGGREASTITLLQILISLTMQKDQNKAGEKLNDVKIICLISYFTSFFPALQMRQLLNRCAYPSAPLSVPCFIAEIMVEGKPMEALNYQHTNSHNFQERQESSKLFKHIYVYTHTGIQSLFLLPTVNL